jgi:hypothetical protein
VSYSEIVSAKGEQIPGKKMDFGIYLSQLLLDRGLAEKYQSKISN